LTAEIERTTNARGDGRPRRNNEVAWGDFEAAAYFADNYRRLRDDDRTIIRVVANFFSDSFTRTQDPSRGVGVDVGSGANLYPALTMVPWCDRVVLTDVAQDNIDWLRANLAPDAAPAPSAWEWQDFWDVQAGFPGYSGLGNVRSLLAARCEVRRLSVFDLPAAAFDVGTMFFVAESVTACLAEFETAVGMFVRALRPASPFAAAFMAGSKGYDVSGRHFPAVDVDASRVDALLAALATRTTVTTIPVPPGDRLRDGYRGMVIAVGTTAGRGRR
jgi:hypothetical protein